MIQLRFGEGHSPAVILRPSNHEVAWLQIPAQQCAVLHLRKLPHANMQGIALISSVLSSHARNAAEQPLSDQLGAHYSRTSSAQKRVCNQEEVMAR